MSTRRTEYSLMQLLEDTSVEQILEEDGIDERSLELLLEASARHGQAASLPVSVPFFG